MNNNISRSLDISPYAYKIDPRQAVECLAPYKRKSPWGDYIKYGIRRVIGVDREVRKFNGARDYLDQRDYVISITNDI